MSAINGHDPLQAAIDAARQQEHQQQMLHQVLTQTMRQPMRVTQITGPSMIGMMDNPAGGKLLMVAQPNGDRIDIPIDVATGRSLAQQLLAIEEQAAADSIEGAPA